MDSKSTSDKSEDDGCNRQAHPATGALAQHVDSDDDGEILQRLRNQALRYVMDPEECLAAKGMQQVQKESERLGNDVQVQISEATTEIDCEILQRLQNQALRCVMDPEECVAPRGIQQAQKESVRLGGDVHLQISEATTGNINQGIERSNEMGKQSVVLTTDAVGRVLIVGGNTIAHNSNEQDESFLKQILRQMDTLGEVNQDILDKNHHNCQLQSSSTEHISTLPSVIVPRSRLITIPGAQHIGNRALSQDYSVTGQQSVYEPEEQIPPPILTARAVDEEIAMQDSATVIPMPTSIIRAKAEILQDPQPIWKILLTNKKYQGVIAFFVLLVVGLVVGLVLGVGLPPSSDFVQSAAKSPSSSPTPLQSFRPYLSTRLMNASLTALDSPGSPQQKALASIDSDARNLTDTHRLQRWILHVLHGFTNGSKWIDDSGWLLESTECTWMNVFCDPLDVEVISLLLSGNNLEGSMPEELALLTSLQILDFEDNLLSGTIPSLYGELTNLQKLHVGNNTLTGTVPKTIENLLSLEYLSIEFNSISGFLPKGLMELKNLSLLHAEGNDLSGTLPFGEWSSWLDLRLSGNNLTGSISSSIGLLTNLTTIDLGQNFFESTLPSEFGELTELQFLRAYGNLFSGNVPTDLGLLTKLKQLYLHGNYLNGTIPTELGRLTGLQALYLNTNKFTGSIPSQLGQLTGLTMLSLEGNLLSGRLPSELGSLTKILGHFSLANTSLTGTVPASLCQPSVTITIDCCHMQLCTCCICAFDVKHCNLYSFRPYLSIVLSNASLAALDIIGSPQQQALVWIESGKQNITDAQRLQRWALYVLHGATNGDKWTNSWKSSFDANECTWTNVICEDGKVARLSLGGNGLDGRIPEELTMLRALDTLELHDNSLTGTLPSMIGHLSNLIYLSLDVNVLTGPLPESIGDLLSLYRLSIHTNHFSGPLPTRISELKDLTMLDAKNNNLSGSLPVDMGKLTAMDSVFLSSNALTGTISSQIGLLTNLEDIYLDNNLFKSSLPSELGMLTRVKVLDFENNTLEGEIPSELAHATNLQYLSLDKNYLNGSIPTELGFLTNLWKLDLSENDFTGTIPADLGRLTNLRQLYLNANFLNGSIPSQIGQLTGLSVLYLGDNFLTGIIPSELGYLTMLEFLMLETNVITGTPILLCQNGTVLKINC